MLKTIRTNFDRHEARRDRRYPLPAIVVTLASGEFATANWSLGGFLLASGPELAIGSVVTGNLVLADTCQTHDFSAELVRRDADGTGFRFVELSIDLVGALDRAIAGRMFRKRA
ncbi:MAG TPA: PilZ domain-containing protein [Stellaceae bacterium]|nr:PilZ domain-containing protein [Stellaceae bacterium]